MVGRPAWDVDVPFGYMCVFSTCSRWALWPSSHALLGPGTTVDVRGTRCAVESQYFSLDTDTKEVGGERGRGIGIRERNRAVEIMSSSCDDRETEGEGRER